MTLSAPYLPSSLARSVRPCPIARSYSLTLRRSASLLPSVTASKVAFRNAAPEDSARTRTSPVSFRSPLPPHARASPVLERRQLPFPQSCQEGGAEDIGQRQFQETTAAAGCP